MKCIAIEKGHSGRTYTVTVETKWFLFKSKCKYMTVRPIGNGCFEWLELPNGNKVTQKVSETLNTFVKEHCA